MVIEDVLSIIVPFVPFGFLLGCLPMLAGLGIHAVVNIIKQI